MASRQPWSVEDPQLSKTAFTVYTRYMEPDTSIQNEQLYPDTSGYNVALTTILSPIWDSLHVDGDR